MPLRLPAALRSSVRFAQDGQSVLAASFPVPGGGAKELVDRSVVIGDDDYVLRTENALPLVCRQRYCS